MNTCIYIVLLCKSYACDQAFASTFYTSFAVFPWYVFVGQAQNVQCAIVLFRMIGK